MSAAVTSSEAQPTDPLTKAAMSVATVIALNKPIYPLYVWWLAPDALKASFWTLLSFPLYAALPFLARRNPYGARVGLIAIGAIDTATINAMLGDGSGAWLFLFACLMLAAMSFRAEEVWSRRITIAGVFVLIAATFGRFPEPLAGPISTESVATIFKLNGFGAASLLAFIGLRYPAGR